MTRAVIEQDFRLPEFRDAKPEDYEFRADGKLVRKDRWEGFEIDEVINSVKSAYLHKNANLKGIYCERG